MIKLLDCTLRDGGYVNNWEFGQKAITDIKNNLEKSGVDIIELGFIRNERANKNRTVFNSMEQVKKLLRGRKLPDIEYTVMAEVSNPYPIEMLDPYDKDSPEIIRVIVWKRMLKEGFEYCKGIVEKGYKLCVQPARVSQYSDEEFVDMINMFNELNPMAIYVVDSWGTMYKDELLHYLKLADENLKDGISVGYHGHNNMMQVFDVAQAFCEYDLKRDLIIDGSVYGIGRGAGNLNTELFAKWANEKLDKEYDVLPLIRIYDKYIKKIYKKEKWGFSIPYLITAKYNANPNFAGYYEKKGLSGEIIERCISAIPSEDRIIFKPEIAKEYLKFVNNGNGNTIRNLLRHRYNGIKLKTDVHNLKIYNFDNNKNCFVLSQDVKSNMLYGTQDNVEDPFITIFIPTYKRYDLFKEALDSVLNQQSVNFEWNIIVVDNEPYDGNKNENQLYIESLNSDKITYYRNDANLPVGQNFNRGIYLAKAPWVMMLHDDDLLVANALIKMGNSIKFLSKRDKKPLGAIAATGLQFYYDEKNKEKQKKRLALVEQRILNSKTPYNFQRLDTYYVLMTAQLGGDRPTNGAVYNREAMIKVGGFNDDNGLSDDTFLYYRMDKYYATYRLVDITGFCRFGMNQMATKEVLVDLLKNNLDFREYCFNKNIFNKLWGFLFRDCLYYQNTKDLLRLYSDKTNIKSQHNYYWEIYNNRPRALNYIIWKCLIKKNYIGYKNYRSKELRKEINNLLCGNKEEKVQMHARDIFNETDIKMASLLYLSKIKNKLSDIPFYCISRVIDVINLSANGQKQQKEIYRYKD